MSRYKDVSFKIKGEDFFSGTFKKLSNEIVGTAAKFRSLRLSVANIKTIAMSAIGGYFAKTIIDTGDHIHKLNQKLGVSTEALSQYKYAMESSRTSFETFTASIQKMMVNVSEAVNGKGKAIEVFKELKIEVNDFKKLKPEEQFEVIADRLLEVSDETDKARIATKIFGDSGVALLQAMTGGSDGLRKMREEAHNLGLTLSQTDANAMASFGDALGRLKSSFNALMQEVVIVLMPALVWLMDLIKNSLVAAVNIFKRKWDELGEALNYILEDFFELEGGMKTAAKGIAYAFEVCCGLVQKYWLSMKTVAVGATAVLLDAIGIIMEKTSSIMNKFGTDNGFTKYLSEKGAMLSDAKNGLDEYLQSMMQVQSYEELSKSFDFNKDKDSKIGQKVDFKKTEFAPELSGDALKEYNKLLQQRNQILNEIQTPMEKFMERMALLDQLNQAGLLTQLEYNKAFEQAQTNFEKTESVMTFEKALQSVGGEAMKMGDILKNGVGMAIDGLASEITEFVLTGKANFLELAGSIAKMVLEMTIKLLILKTLMTALGIPTVAFAKGGVFSSGNNLTTFASGGVVNTPTLFPMSGGRTGLMGEAGAEAIMPLTRGQDGKLGVKMYNKGNKGNAEPQSITNISFNVKSDRPEEFRRSQAQIEADLIGVINRAKRNS